MLHFDDFVILDGNCSNCSIRHFNEAFASNNNQILVMNFNIQSFESKFDELSAFLDEINTKPHVLILTETWFAPLTTREILGYKAYHCTRTGENARGGVSVYILETLNLSCLHFSCKVKPDLETITRKKLDDPEGDFEGDKAALQRLQAAIGELDVDADSQEQSAGRGSVA